MAKKSEKPKQTARAQQGAKPTRPNILILWGDDIGW